MVGMGIAIAGVLLLAVPVHLASRMTVRLRREGASARPAVRHLLRSPNLYFGLGLIGMAVSDPLGEVAFVALFVWLTIVLIRLLTRLPGAIRRLPRAVRDVGDPAAWRGES